MTQNQIAYARLKEDQRSNLANEALKQDQINIALGELGVKSRQADIAAYQAGIAEDKLQWDQEKYDTERDTDIGMKLIDGIYLFGSELVRGYFKGGSRR